MIEKIIEILKYILLGLVQGITEVLPISSSGHLAITNQILGIKDDSITLSVFLHLASLIAVIIFLRKELKQLIIGFFGFIFKDRNKYKKDFLLAIYLVITTSILVMFTVLMKLIGYDSSPLWVIGACLILNAIMLFFLGRFTGTKKLEEMTWKDAIIIGLFQCAGSFPGISRSGSCLCGCQVSKIEKEASAKYAFLLFIPAILGGTVLELGGIASMFEDTSRLYLYLISFVVSFVATYFAFAWLKKIINKGKLTGFSIYCAIIGLAVLIAGIWFL